MKKILVALIAGASATAAFADQPKAEISIPDMFDTRAEQEAARAEIRAAAVELCAQVRYSGVSTFYRARLTQRCVEATYDAAIAQQPGAFRTTALDLAADAS